MFKSLAIAALSLVSMTAFAADIEFYSKFLNQECVIKNGVATKTVSFGKERDIKIKTQRNVSIEGLSKYIDVAIERTVSVPHEQNESSYKITKNGKTVEIFQDDSVESLLVIQSIVQACK